MPELPEVDALVGFLRKRAVGHAVVGASVAAISALKTFDPPLQELTGRTIDAASRHGKFVDLEIGGLHLVFHLARAGWLRWYDELPKTVIKPGKSPIALRVRLDDGSGFDLTEAGTKKSLAVYVVHDPAEVPGIARLGPDPTAPDFTLDDFAAILAGRRTQVKGLLRDQSVFAGVGNAYSDEILHNARMSPYALAAKLKPDDVERLYHALRDTLADAIDAAAGRRLAGHPAVHDVIVVGRPDELKDSKRTRMQVHGRTGEPCPACGDTVREVIFADSTFQYCPTCQTGGKPLADRVLSRLLK